MKILFYISIYLIIFYSSSSKGEDYAGWTVGKARNGYGAIYRTIDSGKNWVRQGSNQIANADLNGVYAVDPLTAWVVGVAESNYATIYNTIDGGVTWNRKGLGQSTLQGISLGKVHVSSNNIWAVDTGVILHSSDNGDSWTNCLPIEYTNTLFQGVFSINGDIVWVSGSGIGNNGSDFATILKTTTTGQSWTRQSGGAITNVDHLLGISAADTQTLWAVGGGGFIVLRSDNGGSSWILQSQESDFGDANEVYAVDSNTVWVAADNFIQWSNDSGITWSNKTSVNYTMGISAVNKAEAWIAISDNIINTGYVWHTSNNGETWENQLSSAPPLWTISFARESIPEPFYLLFIIYQLLFINYLRK